jgi:hypothetical protein
MYHLTLQAWRAAATPYLSLPFALGGMVSLILRGGSHVDEEDARLWSIGTVLLTRVVRFCLALDRLQDVLGLVTLAAGGSTLVSAAIGVARSG